MTDIHSDKILILDFGAQYTQLIARRIREIGVYCEIWAWDHDPEEIAGFGAKGIILSGGPESTTQHGAPKAPQQVFDSGLPILGICYGQQVMTHQLGGEVKPGHETGEGGEFGRAFLTVTAECALFDGLWEVGERHQVWMSHGDKVTQFAPGFEIVATSDGAPFAVIADEARKFYGTQFHPEVVHTPDGARLIANFVRHVCGLAGDWTMAEFRKTKIAEIRAQVGDKRVICGLSGGVDSAVAAALVHRAIGAQLTCVYVDTGLMRKGESDQVVETFKRNMGIELIHVDSGAKFFDGLKGTTEPEAKRKIIGELFVRVFEQHTGGVTDAEFLVQGTLYPDLIESGGTVSQETRHWDDATGRTETLRTKEDADDYRYFLEPDLVPLVPEQSWIDQVRAALPVLPAARRNALAELCGVDKDGESAFVVVERGQDEYVREVVGCGGDPRRSVIYVQQAFAEQGPTPKVSARDLAALTILERDAKVTSTQAKTLLTDLIEAGGGDVVAMAAKRGFEALDTGALEAMVDAAIAAEPGAWQKYCAGEEKAMGALVGAIMKSSQGKADGKVVTALLQKKRG